MMTTSRHCWRRDLQDLTPQQRRAAVYAMRLLGLPRDLSDGRLDIPHLVMLWDMLEPLIDPRGLAHYLRPPPALLEGVDLTGVDPGDTEDEGDESWSVGSGEAVLQALRVALKEEDPLAGEGNHDPRLRGMTQHFLLQRLRGLLHRIPPTVMARLDRANPGGAPASPTVALLGSSLDLAGAALRVLDFLDAIVFNPNLSLLLRYLGDRASVAVNYRRMAHLLNLRETELRRVLAKGAPLRNLGLVEVYITHSDLEDFLRPSDLLSEVLDAAPTDTEALLTLLIEPAPAAVWPLRAFPHLVTPSRLAGEALATAVANRVPGVNALLYGPPGTGKTELARALAAERGLRAYQVRSADDAGSGLNRTERLSAYLLAQRLLCRRGEALLIFDEVEDVFDASENLFVLKHADHVIGRQKGWMNRILEENPVPAIWIANHTGSMDPAFLRRFLLPVECVTPPRSVRRQIAEHHLGNRGLAPELLDDLADDQALAPAQLGAARQLLDLCPTTPPEHVVRAGIGALRTLLHGARAPRQRPSATRFDVAFLNLAGEVSPSALVQALGRRGQGTLCFYGPPGTGKTRPPSPRSWRRPWTGNWWRARPRT